MTTKKSGEKSAGHPSAAEPPAATIFERQAPPAPRLQATSREALAGHPPRAAAPASAPDAPAGRGSRAARDVILRLVETLKEL